MQYWIIPLSTVLSLIILFLVSKLIGYRTIASMSMFDYVNSIAIGSIAAQLSVAEGPEIAYNIIAMILYGILTLLCALASEKFKVCRNILVGHPIVLIDKGKIYFKHFKKAHVEVEEFQSMARQLGYFDLSKIDTAILETSGMLSIIPIAEEKPVVAADINLEPQQEELLANIILDGDICIDNLNQRGKDKKWLEKEIARYKITDRSRIALATLDSKDQLTIYIKVEPPKEDNL